MAKILIVTGDAGESYEALYAVHSFREAGWEPVVAPPSARLRNDARRDTKNVENRRAGENRRREDNSHFIDLVRICGNDCIKEAPEVPARRSRRLRGPQSKC